uniref:Uncharacterized protein n=1 Tax=Anguilla anguilla TaxID=7936 RepID=A0A0E9U3Q3_ANGAN
MYRHTYNRVFFESHSKHIIHNTGSEPYSPAPLWLCW